MNIDGIDFRTPRTEEEVLALAGRHSPHRPTSRRPVVIELNDVEFDTDDEDGVIDLQVLVILDGYVPADPGSRLDPPHDESYEDVLGVWSEWPTIHGDRCWAEVTPGTAFYEAQVEHAQEAALDNLRGDPW